MPLPTRIVATIIVQNQQWSSDVYWSDTPSLKSVFVRHLAAAEQYTNSRGMPFPEVIKSYSIGD